MTMSFLLHDPLSEMEPAEITVPGRVDRSKQGASSGKHPTIFEDKLKVPDVGKATSRNRLIVLVDRSVAQYGATLISGRAGTGKTTLAAEYARRAKRPLWLTIDPADAGWSEFSALFSTSLGDRRKRPSDNETNGADAASISRYLTDLFGKLAKRRRPQLIVLDNVHHLFDAVWFAEFFRQLILSLGDNTSLLMLCRSKPNAPLWRLRSKQMLNVIDESLLELSEDEAFEIGRLYGASKKQVKAAVEASFGRVGLFLKHLSNPVD